MRFREIKQNDKEFFRFNNHSDPFFKALTLPVRQNQAMEEMFVLEKQLGWELMLERDKEHGR